MSTNREPQIGDEIFVPSEHDDGHWTNGIINAIERNGILLVACPGHRYSNLVLVQSDKYLAAWCWPDDVGKVGTGTKPSTLDEVTG